MKKYFQELKNKGYYILLSKGEFKGKIFYEYQVTKNDPTKDSRLIACWLNKKAFFEVKKIIDFKIIDDTKKVVFHSGSLPIALNFTTQIKESLMLN
jgi:hypothetical protein